MKIKLLACLAAILLLAPSAQASVIYIFDFYDLTGVTGGTGADFGITLTYPDYVTTTGMAPAPGAPFATSLGYPVAYAGTQSLGGWGFDDDTNSVINDSGFGFGGESFYFIPDVLQAAYFTAPGTFPGSVQGNAPTSFSGLATLTITDTAAVPEPATLTLLGLGLAGLRIARRRR